MQFNEKENFFTDGLYEGYLSTFIYRDIGKKLNMSWDDFISRPRHEIEIMLKVIEEADKRKQRINETLMKDLEQSVPKAKLDEN